MFQIDFFLKKEDLQELLKKVKEGNQKAQTKLINYFWEDVFGFILKKVQDKVTADELTVVVFTKVLAKSDLYDENFEFKTWILTIAQNSVIDYWRKESKKETLTENLAEVKNEFEKYSWKEIEIPIIANTTGNVINNVNEIKEELYRQTFGPVKWVDTINRLYENGVTKIYEVGCGKVLAGLIKKINKDIEVINIENIENINNL